MRLRNMQWAKRLVLTTLLAAIPGFGFAANLVTNGSFESGMTGWTATGACSWQGLTSGSATAHGNFNAPAPTDGTHSLISDTSQADTGSCTLYQDVAIPSAGSSGLTLAAGYKAWNYGEFGTDASCSAKVEVTTTAGALIATVYTSDGSNSQALAAKPAVDLSAQKGTTVRLIFTANSCNAAPFGNRAVVSALVDNVVLNDTAAVTTVPTLSEWGVVILACLMVLAAFYARGARAPGANG